MHPILTVLSSATVLGLPVAALVLAIRYGDKSPAVPPAPRPKGRLDRYDRLRPAGGEADADHQRRVIAGLQVIRRVQDAGATVPRARALVPAGPVVRSAPKPTLRAKRTRHRCPHCACS